MNNIQIEVKDGRCAVTSPYNKVFVEGARQLNGKWQSPHWVFDARDEAAVRQLCQKVYGTDGHVVADLVSVRVTYTDGADVLRGALSMAGRSLAFA